MEKGATTYRPDIDGLRAVAVIAVLLFHAKNSWLPGGFSGVDIFFVISGFLISSHILSELDEGKFSLVRFYERRVRRIFPALAAVLAASTAAASALFLPAEFTAFGKSLAAAALSGSNILFWREIGYFHIISQLKPLLHTWTLGVEEQFYILFPLFLYAVHRFFGRRFSAFVPAAWAGSFAVMLWGVTHGQEAASFFLLPTRAWELLTGSLLASGLVKPLKNTAAANAVTVFGAAAIAAGFVMLRPEMPYLSVWVFVPVAGAAAMIYAGSAGAVAGRVLACRPLVFIGLISYSLYLWHWPVFVFTRYYLIDEPGTAGIAAMTAATAILSVISWKYIESPFRRKGRVYSLKKVFGWFFALNAAFLAIGLSIFLSGGYPGRFSQEVLDLANADKGVSRDYEAFHGGERIVLGDTSGAAAPAVLVWGDSHANSMAYVIDRAAAERKVPVLMLKQAGCMPFYKDDLPQAPYCLGFEKAVLEFVAARPELKTIVLIARWSAYPRWWDHGDSFDGSERTREDFSVALTSTVAALKKLGRRVVLVTEPPHVNYPASSVLARIALYGRALDIRPALDDFLAAHRFDFGLFEALKKEYAIEIVYAHDSLCAEDGKCAVVRDGKSLYTDGNHLSREGSMALSDAVKRIF